MAFLPHHHCCTFKVICLQLPLLSFPWKFKLSGVDGISKLHVYKLYPDSVDQKILNIVFILNFQSSVGLIQEVTLRSVAVEFMAVKREEKETQLNQSAAVMCGFYKQGPAVDKTECFELYHDPWANHFNTTINTMFNK